MREDQIKEYIRILNREHRVLLGVVMGVVAFSVATLFLWQLVDPKTPEQRTGFIQTIGGIVGGSALLVGLYFTARNLQVNRQGQITERFTRAIDQLGAVDGKGDKNIEVRLGGIYALERIARDSEHDHWTIMEILTAYVREHASQHGDNSQDKNVSLNPGIEYDLGELEPPPILDIPRPSPDVEAALQVLGRRTRYSEQVENNHMITLDGISLRGKRLFPPVNLEGVSLAQADLAKAYLHGTNFKRAHLWYANLEDAYLMWAQFTGAYLTGASLKGAHLHDADLEGALLLRPNLEGAYLQRANLNGLELQGANLRDAHLHHTKLNGTNLQGADLGGAHLQSADLRQSIGLAQEQLECAIGDDTTKLPSNLKHPASWQVNSDERSEDG